MCPTLAGMARFSARCLLIAGFLYVVGRVVRSLPLVFLSSFVALLLTTLLAPVADWLARHRVPRSLAAGGTVLLGVAAVGGLLVRDGDSMLRSSLSPLPPVRRQRVHAAAHEAWKTLSPWVRGTVLVALIDAAGIGIGLWVLGVPLALLTFLAAFVPIIGAVVAGTVAVLVAWAMVGLEAALITLAIVLAVQQLEGNVLQPVIMGRVLPLHPAVVILAVATGTLLAGVAGALAAVPLLPAVTSGTRAFLAERHGPRERDEERPEAPGDSEEAPPPAMH